MFLIFLKKFNFFFFNITKLYICELILEQEGVFEYVTIGEVENDLIRLDHNILSMENIRFFSDYFMVFHFF